MTTLFSAPWRRTGLLWILSGVFALSFRFGWGDIGMADWICWYVTYPLSCIVTAGFAYAMSVYLFTRREWFVRHAWPLIVVMVITGIVLVTEPHFLKVHADEPSHGSLALFMHKQRACSIPFVMHYPFDVPTWDYTTAPFRGHYFSFLVSLAHDIFGPRTNNLYIVNGLIGAATLAVVYALGWRLTQNKLMATAGAVLLLSAPIYGQVMCSGSYDLTNLLFLALLVYFITDISLRKTCTTVDTVLITLTAVLLCYCRPESIIYYGFAMGALIYTAWRSHQLDAIRKAEPLFITAPLLCFPALTTQMILMSKPFNLHQGNCPQGTPMLSLDHGIRHWMETFGYFLNASAMQMSSVLLFSIGTIGILLILVHLIGKRSQSDDLALTLTYVTVGLIAVGLYSMVMCSFWGGATNPVMTRFTLPLWLILTLATLLCCRRLLQKTGSWLPRAMLAGALYYFTTSTMHAHAVGKSVSMHLFGYGMHRAVDWIKTHPESESLYVADLNAPFIIENLPTTRSIFLGDHPMSFIKMLKTGYFKHMYVVSLKSIDPKTGSLVASKGDWNKISSQWTVEPRWHAPITLGMSICIDEIIGADFEGKHYDLRIKDFPLPTGKSMNDIQAEYLNMLPALQRE